MKILITGSEGFFGSHLVDLMLRQDIELRCFVQYNSFSSIGWLEDLLSEHPKLVDQVFFGDIRDLESVQKAMKDIDICINLAALIAIPYSYLNPRGYFETNVIGTQNVAESALRANVKRLIHVSTSEVYGSPKYTPIDEGHPINAQSPYAASKASADHLVLSYYYSFELPALILRPFNLFGPRQSTRAVIPSVITQALIGNSIRLGATTPTREFNFAPEIARAFLSAALSEKGIGETFNVGNGVDFSISEMVEEVLRIMQKECEIVEDVERLRPKLSEVIKLQSNSSKFTNTFDWKYAYSGKDGFQAALGKTIDWYSQTPNLQKFRGHRYGI
jgi:NAD dependent epimerase/dehydratase